MYNCKPRRRLESGSLLGGAKATLDLSWIETPILGDRGRTNRYYVQTLHNTLEAGVRAAPFVKQHQQQFSLRMECTAFLPPMVTTSGLHICPHDLTTDSFLHTQVILTVLIPPRPNISLPLCARCSPLGWEISREAYIGDGRARHRGQRILSTSCTTATLLYRYLRE